MRLHRCDHSGNCHHPGAASLFVHELPDYIGEVAVALLPIIAIFILFQLIFRRFQRHQLLKW